MSTRRFAGNEPANGPKFETPLSRYFYEVWVAGGRLPMEAIGERSGVPHQTIYAYVHGIRKGRQPRSAKTVVAVAAALGADRDEALRRAGQTRESHILQSIDEAPELTNREKKTMRDLYLSLTEQRSR